MSIGIGNIKNLLLIELFCFIYSFIYSDTAVSGFSYCGENGLNFSANSATFSEDDADFTPGRRNKPSRVSIYIIHLPSV